MPHIPLVDGVPGIRSAFLFSPETARPMLALAEVLLRGESTLSRAEREMIAARVSHLNACHFCEASHRAAAAHHLDGDYVLVERSEVARNGDKVVALLPDGQTTLKTFFKEEDFIRLQPANPAFEPIRVRFCQIQGIVKGVLRRY